MCYLLSLIVQRTTFNVLQMRLLGECRGSIDTVKKMGFELKEEEDAVSGLADPSGSESQTSGNTTQQSTLTHTNSVRYVWVVSPASHIPLPSRSDRALGAPAGSGSQQRDSHKAKPAAATAAELRSEQDLGLAGADRGRAGAAAKAGALHGHSGHWATHQKAQGWYLWKLRVQLFLNFSLIICICTNNNNLNLFWMLKHL